jgi:sulfur-oxidizing protein SoxA
MKKIIIIFLYLILFPIASSSSEDPEEIRQFFLKVFEKNLPGVAVSDYVNGAMIRSADALEQFESIMDFPPFQGDIELGKAIWETPLPSGATYADCLPNRGVNIAGHYPIFDEQSKTLISFEMLINDCLEKNGGVAYSFDDRKTMGALTAYARKLSDGMSMDIKVESEGALQKFEAGRAFYFKRIGQHNLACASCHLTHGGNYFRDELISPTIGQPVHFPVFRAGERLYTLHMRYQRCMEAVGAVPFAAGSEELNSLEYFHSYLSNGLPLRASIYRR